MIYIDPKRLLVKDLVEILLKCNQNTVVSLAWCDDHWDHPENTFCIGIEENENRVIIATEKWLNYGKEEND